MNGRDASRRPSPAPWRVSLVVAANDLRRKVRDRTALLMGVVTPLVMAGVIGLAFGGGISFSARITVVDGDGSSMSTGLVDGLVGGMPADAPVRLVRSTDLAGAQRDLQAGSTDAVIIVPAGFGASIPAMSTGGRPASLRVLTDANKRIAGDVARSIADGVSARIGASVVAITTTLEQRGAALDAATIASIVQEGQQVTVPIALAQADAGDRYPPVAYFGASMGILFLFFTVGSGARSLIIERKEGTLSRVRAAPVSDRAVLFGKSLGVLVLGLASLVCIWAITTAVFRSPWGDPRAVLAVIVASVIAVTGVSTLVAGLARTDAQADGMTSVVAFVFALLGGSFLQPGSLPGLLDKLTLLTPNGWALRAFTLIGAGGAGPGDVLPHVAVLVLIGVVTALVGVRALSRKALA